MEVQRDWVDYVDVFGGLIIGILTFILGYALSNIIERRKAKRDQKECRSFFNVYWKEQLEKTYKQIEFMNDLANRLESYESFEGIQVTNQLHPFYLYDAIDKQKLVESFRAQGKEEQIIKRMGFIELLRFIREEYLRGYERFKENNKRFGEDWNTSMLEFAAMKMQIMALPKDTLLRIPEVVEINNRYNLSFNKSITTPEIARDIVYPLDKYLREVYSKNPSNQYAMTFLPILARLKIAYQHNKVHSTAYSSGLKDLINTLQEALDKVKANSN